MPYGSFTHPTVGRIQFEFAMPTSHTDAYIISFLPDHADNVFPVDADEAPADWHALAGEGMGVAMAEARADGEL